VGRFFGQIDGDILNVLISANVFRPVKMFDYQAICLDPESEAFGPSASPFFFSILSQLLRLVSHICTLLSALYLNVLYGEWNVFGSTINNPPAPSAVRQDWGQDPTVAAGKCEH